ncbi:hypothetical protein [Photobacterium sp. OFAV2-7]|uniref:hypothetical protein n=1 Tax=Photobacterium sp. OFAV2-7 TaxID=2917748 RepID=UPI001EF51BFC|nr:hypothetical protein [Photobacterium sp. OFAV2-7]MCG7584571.1 hypothetical protein [Photobacterium sp. OFAV2-7]
MTSENSPKNKPGWHRGSLVVLSIVFGVVLPCVIIVNAFLLANRVADNLLQSNGISKQLLTDYSTVSGTLKSDRDYELFAAVFLENQNSQTFINKQLLKTVVIHIGFVMISIGVAFIILGVEDKGIDVSGEGTWITFNLKTGSVGLCVFLAGALLAAGGGLIPNEYKTITITSTAVAGETPPSEQQIINEFADFVRQQCETKLETIPDWATLTVDQQQRKLALCLGRAFLSNNP